MGVLQDGVFVMCFYLLAVGCFTTLTPVPLEATAKVEGSLGQQLSGDACFYWYRMDEAGLQIRMSCIMICVKSLSIWFCFLGGGERGERGRPNHYFRSET